MENINEQPRKNFGGTKRKLRSNQRTKKSFLINPVLLYIKSLKKIYPSCMRDNKDNNQKYKNHIIVYGEMEYDGIETFYKKVMQHFFDEYVFIDIGSGRGKIPIYLASKQQIIKSIGIEVVKERHADALCLYNRMKDKSKSFSPITKKVFLFNKDLFDVDFSQMSSIKDESDVVSQKKTLIWISNLCFPKELSIKVFEKFSKELLPGSIICCSKNPFIEEAVATQVIDTEIMQKNKDNDDNQNENDLALNNSDSDTDSSSESDSESSSDDDDEKSTPPSISLQEHFRLITKIENFPMSWSHNSSIFMLMKESPQL